MSGKYDNYFNDLRNIDKKVDRHFQGDNNERTRLYRNYVRNHPHFLNLESETTRGKSNQINNIIGAMDILNTPKPLPISHYKRKEVDYDTTGVHTSGYKNLHYDIEENEVIHKPNPSVKPHSRNNLPHNDDDEQLQKLVNKGLARVYNKPTKKDKSLIKPKVEGEKSAMEVSKMSDNEKIDYAKKMATIYRDKGIKGGFRLPNSFKPNPPPTMRRPIVNPTPKPTPKAPVKNGGDLPPPPPPDTSGMII